MLSVPNRKDNTPARQHPRLAPPPLPMLLPACITVDCPTCGGLGWVTEYPSAWSREEERGGVQMDCPDGCSLGALTLYLGEWAGQLHGYCSERNMAGNFASHEDMLAGHFRQDWTPGRRDFWMLAALGVSLERAAEVCR